MDLLKRILKRLFGSVVLATVTLVGAPVAFGATILAGLIFLPLPASIPLPKPVVQLQPTIIYDRYGHQIASVSQFESNLPFTDAQVPAVLKEAVIADEDRNYYHESGVDIRGLVRALVADLRNKATVQGGSTITQQYVKLAYLGSQRTIVRKVREAILASQLARQASKEEILYHYLSLIYLGDGNTGVESASEAYFHVPVQALNPSQAATLSGLIPAPSSRAPEEHLSEAEYYRQLVLKKMYDQHYLTYADYQHWLTQKLAMAGTAAAVPGKATIVYPEVYSSKTEFPDFVDYVQRWLTSNIPPSVLAQGGLRVQTTMDPAVENDARAVVAATLDGSAMPVDMAMAAVEPSTGFVAAVVGGRYFGDPLAGKYRWDNFALGGCQDPRQTYRNVQVTATASCWDGSMITGGGGGRQPGSSFKPFTLATAFEQGIPPSTVYPAPYVYQIPGCVVTRTNNCQIHNDEGDIGAVGQQNLAFATANSTNTVYAQVAQQVGCPNVATTAKKLGIESAYYSTPPFYFCASYALGEVGVSPLDMASAYGVFANHGQRAAPTPILEIVNAQGKVLVDNIRPLPKTTSAIPANVADNVTNVLQGVIQAGTGKAADIGRPAAGKTGTTTNNTDAWFVGYTPTLSTAVWMGDASSDATPIGYSLPACPHGCVTGHYLNGPAMTFNGLYGGQWPAIAWKEFMQLALAKVPVTPFSAPAPIVTPQEAAALRAPRTTTTVPIEPGYGGVVQPTPSGGPYVYPATPPVAAPPTSAPAPTTTTTAPPPDTTTTTANGSPPSTG
ncbi:MAG TPA: transglycosylase domain-containing protein [Acidimicrobiales bacterium]|nr:transglycosylase domain-containing protein [Acidimicrobiales bacterium]